MPLLVLHIVFVRLAETWLTDPLTEPPGLPAITTPVDTAADLYCYTSNGRLTWKQRQGDLATTYGRDISRSVLTTLDVFPQ